MTEAFTERVEQVEQLQMLLRLSREVAALDTLDAVLDTLVEAAKAELGAQAGSLFLHDGDKTTDLGSRQIRVLDHLGIVGAVYRSGVGEIVHDAYADARFNQEVDRETGFSTESILCAPVRNAKGETIGAAEMLNKLDGEFTAADLALLEGITSQCAMTLETMQLLERTARSRRREIDFLNVVSDLTAELDLGRLLGRVMSEATAMLDADRSTLFLHDASPVRCSPRRRRCGSRTRTPTCASTRPSTGRPVTSRDRFSACRSSTRPARRSASPRS